MAPRSVLHRMEQGMGMTGAVWARHANPWSVYTRFTCLPLIILAIWSRIWLGWYSLIPIAASLIWTWANPRVFAPPARLDNWASHVVLGERVYLHHKSEVGAHHLRAANVLSLIAGIGLIPLIYGLWALDIWPTLFGLTISVIGKIWFCDRMVWVWENWVSGGRGVAELDQ